MQLLNILHIYNFAVNLFVYMTTVGTFTTLTEQAVANCMAFNLLFKPIAIMWPLY